MPKQHDQTVERVADYIAMRFELERGETWSDFVRATARRAIAKRIGPVIGELRQKNDAALRRAYGI